MMLVNLSMMTWSFCWTVTRNTLILNSSKQRSVWRSLYRADCELFDTNYYQWFTYERQTINSNLLKTYLVQITVLCWASVDICICITLQWRHNGRDSVSNHKPHDGLLNHVFRRRSKKTSKPSATGLCAGHSPMTGEFLAQMASNAENVSICLRHHTSTV